MTVLVLAYLSLNAVIPAALFVHYILERRTHA